MKLKTLLLLILAFLLSSCSKTEILSQGKYAAWSICDYYVSSSGDRSFIRNKAVTLDLANDILYERTLGNGEYLIPSDIKDGLIIVKSSEIGPNVIDLINIHSDGSRTSIGRYTLDDLYRVIAFQNQWVYFFGQTNEGNDVLCRQNAHSKVEIYDMHEINLSCIDIALDGTILWGGSGEGIFICKPNQTAELLVSFKEVLQSGEYVTPASMAVWESDNTVLFWVGSSDNAKDTTIQYFLMRFDIKERQFSQYINNFGEPVCLIDMEPDTTMLYLQNSREILLCAHVYASVSEKTLSTEAYEQCEGYHYGLRHLSNDIIRISLEDGSEYSVYQTPPFIQSPEDGTDSLVSVFPRNPILTSQEG